MIGENDFTTTCDYSKLVALINNKLSRLSHTNFTLCLLTHKSGDYIIAELCFITVCLDLLIYKYNS